MKLSVVIPVYNERDSIAGTLAAAKDALSEASVVAEIIVVDDGSTDGSGEAAKAAADVWPLRVLRQANAGRFAARSRGLEAAAGDYVLFLDSRVRLLPGSLKFAAERVAAGEEIWNAHVVIDADGNPFGQFWNVLTELVFSEYFAEPRTTSFDLANFERFPKGTTCFLAPKEALRSAFHVFTSAYDDVRMANDDTPIIRRLAHDRPIHISPGFRCLYRPRQTFIGFVRHAYHRGLVFLDGHGRSESGFFPLVVAFYPVSAVCALLAIRRPRTAPALAGALSAAAGAIAAAHGRSAGETLSFAVLSPVYAVAHGAGMWRGLVLRAAKRLRP
jgi:glycosyltransferase involved in cell wall biosynthesis